MTLASARLSRRQWRALLVSFALLAAVAAAAAAMTLRRADDARSALLAGDYRGARHLLLSAAQAGEAPAQNALANLYLLGLGVQADHRKAAEWYLKAALSRNVAAQVNLGHLYTQGRGVPKDPLRAFAWYRHAQKAGSQTAADLMRYLVGGMGLTPNQIQWVKQHYATPEALAF